MAKSTSGFKPDTLRGSRYAVIVLPALVATHLTLLAAAAQSPRC